MAEAFICDAVRYAGVLSPVRADDLGAVPIAALLERQANLDTAAVDDVVYGCANQAGEDNRNVARMAALLAGLPPTVPAATVNRLCGSGMNAIGNVADAIQAGGIELAIAGGVESMSRAPFVMAKQTSAFGRNAEIYDTTLGWRFVNRKLEEQYGIDSMAQTAENVAEDFGVSREDQDAFALRSQQRAEAARRHGRTSAAGVNDRGAREAEAYRAQWRYRYGRQCLRHQRRRLCGAGGFRGCCRPPRSPARSASGRLGRRQRKCWRSPGWTYPAWTSSN
jgi:acetyl-CoA acetyltransferase